MVIENLNDKDDDDDVNTEKAKTTNCKWIVSSAQILSCFQISSNGIYRRKNIVMMTMMILMSWLLCVFLVVVEEENAFFSHPPVPLAFLFCMWYHIPCSSTKTAVDLLRLLFKEDNLYRSKRSNKKKNGGGGGYSSCSGGGGGGTELILKLVGFTCSGDVLAR